jgi:16S rRNA (adenine1518-N6/adenine1519-N6)-dimethyltransferase
MFQREVADRLVAVPSTRAYGPLSVLAQEAFRIERLFDLAPRAFRPAPQVVSSVTRWRKLPAEDFPADADAPLRAVLAASFAMRRRTIGNNLRHALGDTQAAEGLLRAAGIAADLRAEALTRADFRRLARFWPAGERP